MYKKYINIAQTSTLMYETVQKKPNYFFILYYIHGLKKTTKTSLNLNLKKSKNATFAPHFLKNKKLNFFKKTKVKKIIKKFIEN